MELIKKNIIELKNNKSKLKRLVSNGFYPNLYLTFNPHQYDCSQMMLMFHLKQALGIFYKTVLKHKRFYKHKDKQYPLIVFLENGRNRDLDEKTPHQHILIQIPEDKINAFVDFNYNYLKQFYPSLTKDATIIDNTGETVNMLNIWMYNDKEQTEFDINPLMIANKIFTTSDFQKPIKFNKDNKYEKIEEWFKSAPVFNPVQQNTIQPINDTEKEKVVADIQTSVLHRIYNTAKSIFTAPLNYIGKIFDCYLLHLANTLPVDDYYLYHIHRQLYEDLADSDEGYG